MNLLIVSGLSGSGKSVALHTLEDLGYYCIDNLPVGLLDALATRLCDPAESTQTQAAVGIDARNQTGSFKEFPSILQSLRDHGVQPKIVFLQARQSTLLQRFSETRRKHPLSGDRLSLEEAIAHERELLEPIAERADVYIDTTHTHVHQLRDLIRERVSEQPRESMSLLFQSFGYKHGIPGDADFVFDARCLPNPHWEPHLRPLTGIDADVAEYLDEQADAARMFQHIAGFLETWLPRFQEDNRSYMTVAIGCTGGQHRSVYLTERLARHFNQTHGNVLTKHRELP